MSEAEPFIYYCYLSDIVHYIKEYESKQKAKIITNNEESELFREGILEAYSHAFSILKELCNKYQVRKEDIGL